MFAADLLVKERWNKLKKKNGGFWFYSFIEKVDFGKILIPP